MPVAMLLLLLNSTPTTVGLEAVKQCEMISNPGKAVECLTEAAAQHHDDRSLVAATLAARRRLIELEANKKKSDYRVAALMREYWTDLRSFDSEKATQVLPADYALVFKYGRTSLANNEPDEALAAADLLDEWKSLLTAESFTSQKLDRFDMKSLRLQAQKLADAAELAEQREAEKRERAEEKREGPFWTVKMVCGGMVSVYDDIVRAFDEKGAVVKTCDRACRGGREDFNYCMRRCPLGIGFGKNCEWSAYRVTSGSAAQPATRRDTPSTQPSQPRPSPTPNAAPAAPAAPPTKGKEDYSDEL